MPTHAVRRLARLVKDAQPFARQRQVDHHARLGGEELTQRAVEHRQPVELVERPHVELGILDDRLQALRIAAGHAARDWPAEVSLVPQLGQQRRRDQVAEDRVAQGVVIDDVLVVELESHAGSCAPGPQARPIARRRPRLILRATRRGACFNVPSHRRATMPG